MDKESITKILEPYNHFQECILEEVRWKHHGATLDLCFNYIWEKRGVVRKDLDNPKLITLSFQVVQEFHLWNGMNEYMISHPHELTWGFSEISLIKIHALEQSPFFRTEILWECERRIEIIFKELIILE